MGVFLNNLFENEWYEDGRIMVGTQRVKRTIEFRTHEGTLDAESIYNWVKVCIGLVDFAQEVETANLRAWLKYNAEKASEEYSVVVLLHALKMPAAALYYEKKLGNRRAR